MAPPCINGMLVFQTLPETGLAKTIIKATHSPIAHVGIMAKKGEACTVIQAFGDRVHETPLDEFLSQSGKPDQAWYKVARVNSGQTDLMVEKARAKIGQAYDAKFLSGNRDQAGKELLYCSELVEQAAREAGIDLGAVATPAAWLDPSHISVITYLQRTHGINPSDAIPADWLLITPRDLFYSDQLADPNFTHAELNRPESTAPYPNHAVYDTLPGKDRTAKAQYLKREWGGLIKKVTHEQRTDASGQPIYRFTVAKAGKTYSLVLLGRFEEERKLAEEIISLLTPSKR